MMYAAESRDTLTASPDRRVRGIFFDLDDTLIAYSAAERAALKAGCLLAAQTNPAIGERDLAHAILQAYESGYAYGTRGFADLADLPVRDLRRRLTDTALLHLGVVDPELTEQLVEAYTRAEADALCAFPDVVETLHLLRPHFRLGVITNGPSAMQREKLAALHLDGFFEVIVVDTEWGHPKPDPGIFDYAARRVGLPPSDLLFVGNSLEADIAGARAAGWQSVFFNEGSGNLLPENSVKPDYTIACLREIAGLPPVASVLNRKDTAL